MPPKKQKKKSHSFLSKLIILVILVSIGYFLGSNREGIKTFIENKSPQVKEVINETAGKIKESYANIRPPVQPENNVSVVTPSTDELKISSFNIRIFSDKSRDDEELKSIVDILKDTMSISKKTLSKDIAKGIFFSNRTGKRIEDKLNEAINYLIINELIEIKNEKIKLMHAL